MDTKVTDRSSLWLSALERSLTEEVLSPSGDRLPGFPATEWQLHTVGLSGADALREAAKFMEVCVSYFKDSPSWAKADRSLLDFGTGWGRIARCFLRDFKAEHIIGVDVNPHFLAMCHEHFTNCTFAQTATLPPLQTEATDQQSRKFSAESVDFIVAYSVFSHLSQDACLAWMHDFHRLLKPGGMLAVTTRGRWFFDHAESLKGKGLEGYPKGLSEMFDDFDEARARYDSGEFVHANTPLIGDGEHYGESFIPRQYVSDVYGAFFKAVAFHEQTGEHPVIVLQKSR